MKDWKTTVGGAIGVILIAAGLFWPDKVDPATQQAVNAAVAEILQGVGALITALALIFAKDAE